MPIVGQRAGAAFVVTAADVVQHQAAFLQMLLGQFFLDATLPRQQPVHGAIEVIFGGVDHAQFLGQGGAVPQSGSGQLGTGVEDGFDQHGQHQIALATRLGGEDGVEAEFANGKQNGFDMAVGHGSAGGEQVLGGNQGFVAEEATKVFDFVFGPIGEVGQGAFEDFVALTEAFAQQDGGRGVAVGDGFDVHGTSLCTHYSNCQYQHVTYMGTLFKTEK